MDFTIPATENWQEQLEYIATKEGFNFTQDENGDITLQKFSPRRQDFTIELIKPLDYKDALDELNAQLASYDVNEQAMMWYGANRGEPRDLQDLLDDMKWCKNKLQSLTDAVDYHYGFTPADYFNEVVMEDALATTFEHAGLDEYSFSADMQEILLDHMSKYDNPLTGLEEITTHGCVSGVLTDFIYHSDTREFYRQHMDSIEDFISDLEDDLGEHIDLSASSTNHFTGATWLVAEQCASLASDSLEEIIQNTLEAWSEDLTKEQVEAFLQGNTNELIADHLEEALSLLDEVVEEKQDARLDANSEVLEMSYYYISPRGFSNEYTVLKADNTDASKEVIDRLLYEDATNPNFEASLLSKDSPYCKEYSEVLKAGELYDVGLSDQDLEPVHPIDIPYYLPTKSSLAFEEQLLAEHSLSLAENRCVLVSTADLNTDNVPSLGTLSKIPDANCPSYSLEEYEGKFISLDVVYTSVYANSGIIDYTSKPAKELDDVVYYLSSDIRTSKQIEQLADNLCKDYPLSRLDKQELIPLLDAIAKTDDSKAVVALNKYVSDAEQKVANEVVDNIKRQYGYKELPLQSEAPRIVVPSSPVQEQAQAILDARGGDVKSTQKQEQEAQVNKSSLKI